MGVGDAGVLVAQLLGEVGIDGTGVGVRGGQPVGRGRVARLVSCRGDLVERVDDSTDAGHGPGVLGEFCAEVDEVASTRGCVDA